MKIPISEIFYSIQGEGINIGKPAIFIRLYYCNLYCNWCDSKYTWENQKNAKENIDFLLLDAYTIYKKIKDYNSKHVVITGGEPLLHQTSLINLLKLLKNEGFYIEMETNGTLLPNEEIVKYVDLFNVSPKLSNSSIKKEIRIRGNVISFFVKLDKSIFKFVIQNENDIHELMEDFIIPYNIPKEKVILMPEATDEITLKERSLWLIEICKKYNFRYTTRLQILLYGNKRGI